jgi:hypothetical protein
MKEQDTKNAALSPASVVESALSSNLNRRSFVLRYAVIGAAAVMIGRVWTPEAGARNGEEIGAAAAELQFHVI